ncbi:MAG: MBOAT family protein [Anaerolineae bacterium]|nr:MBOAT family protein [Anaerolineae bacterium]
MQIISLEFVGFAIAALIIYYLLPRRLRRVWLLIASYIFYALWSKRLAVALLLITTINYGLARYIQNRALKRRLWMWLGIVFNIAVLVYFKYAFVIVPLVNSYLAQAGMPVGAGIILPAIGISYISIQLIGYLVDTTLDRMPAAANWFDFALYVAYFPKLIAGPVEPARIFLPELADTQPLNNQRLGENLSLILFGLVRKLLFADMLFLLIPDQLFTTPADFTGPELIFGLIAYSFALYNDFAGYTGIVRGVSGLFGIPLSKNFSQPYLSRNFVEFWNRWHISLSHWLRDYIFFPLTRTLLKRIPNRRNLINLIVPPIATMLVSAMWHGIVPGIMLWGLLHGIFQVVQRLPILWRARIVAPAQQPTWKQAVTIVLTFTLAILAWVPFRTALPVTFQFYGGMFSGWSEVYFPARLLVIIIPAVGLDLWQNRKEEFLLNSLPRLAQAAIIALLLILLFFTVNTNFDTPMFVYQGF